MAEERSPVVQPDMVEETEPPGVMKVDWSGQEPSAEQRREHVDGKQKGGPRRDPR